MRYQVTEKRHVFLDLTLTESSEEESDPGSLRNQLYSDFHQRLSCRKASSFAVSLPIRIFYSFLALIAEILNAFKLTVSVIHLLQDSVFWTTQ